MSPSPAAADGQGWFYRPWWPEAAQAPGLRFVVLFALGVVVATGQAPLDATLLSVIALAVALRWLGGVSGPARGWRTFVEGWALGLGYFAASLHWIVEPFFVDAPRHGWLAPFALLFMAGGMALFWGGACLAARALGRGRMTALALVAALAGAEILRSLVFTGFPWALLGHIWIDTPAILLAALGGPHLLTLLTLGCAALLCAVAERRWLFFVFGLLAGVTAAGSLGQSGATPAPDAPLIRIVQPNAIQSQKWEPGMAEEFFGRLLRYTVTGPVSAMLEGTELAPLVPDGPGPALVVWPETAVQYLLETSQAQIDAASEAARGAPLITGIVRRDGEDYYNSLVVIGRAGEVTDIYDKHHLVPFGEYFPFAPTLEGWGLGALTGLVGGGYASGPGPDVVSLPGIGSAVALICYEGIFAEEVNAVSTAARPRLIVLITNDAWFGDWAGPAQHFAQARLRAVEQGLPVVRAANTGISGMIDARGRVTGSLALGEMGALDLPLPPAAAPPPYTRVGDWPTMVLVLLLGLFTALRTAARPAHTS